MKDPRTIADFVINEHGERVGFVWVIFNDIVDYQLVAAEIMDFYIFPEHRRKGIGLAVLQRIEKEAKRRGANLLRSETGVENAASINLHQKFGFEAYRMSFEKRL
jgi:GNAT superfamily N-acetyltransferase